MLENDKIVEAIVKRSEVYGLFCEFDSHEFLVLIPDISWIASFCSAAQFAEPGDAIKAKILAVDTDTGKISGSIRGLYPDPWKAGLLASGVTHTGVVLRHVSCADPCSDGPGYLVEIVPSAFAMLCDVEQPLVRGDSCSVTITASSHESQAVRICLA